MRLFSRTFVSIARNSFACISVTGLVLTVLSIGISIGATTALAADSSANQVAANPAPGQTSNRHARISCLPVCKIDKATRATLPRIKTDRAAALESIQFALSNVGDGGTYVWRRSSSQLSGVVQPTRSFRDTSGRMCRYLYLLVSFGEKTGKAEGIACRLSNGRWNLEG